MNGGHSPIRTCVGCRKKNEKRLLIRFVADDMGHLKIDRKGNAPGRGAYLCLNKSCLEKALKSKSFSRVLKGRVIVRAPESLINELAQLSEPAG